MLSTTGFSAVNLASRAKAVRFARGNGMVRKVLLRIIVVMGAGAIPSDSIRQRSRAMGY
jgi:hypothetical protein